MNLRERFLAFLFPNKFSVRHYCHDQLAAETSPTATETVCQAFEQKAESLMQNGKEKRPARMLIKNGLLAFPIFATLNVCSSCKFGPTVSPTSQLVVK